MDQRSFWFTIKLDSSNTQIQVDVFFNMFLLEFCLNFLFKHRLLTYTYEQQDSRKPTLSTIEKLSTETEKPYFPLIILYFDMKFLVTRCYDSFGITIYK